jgi:hypothetical protein
MKSLASWTSVEHGAIGRLSALQVFDDGNGPALYAGGQFTAAGGTAASRIARWDGSSWSALGAGLDSTVYALAVHDDGSGSALFVGGTFLESPAKDSDLARWGCVPKLTVRRHRL